jgi:hypothetical protein
MNAQGGECFQVSLYSGPAAAVRTGYGYSARKRFLHCGESSGLVTSVSICTAIFGSLRRLRYLVAALPR